MADSNHEEGAPLSESVGSAIKEIARTLTSSPIDDCEENCVLFLGAGAAADWTVPKKERLPLGSELSTELAEEIGMESPQYVPLSTTAFYYESFRSREGLDSYLRNKITKKPPSATTKLVAELAHLLEAAGKQLFIITTNYDQTLETAYDASVTEQKDKLRVIIYDGRSDPNKADSKTALHTPDVGPPEYWRPVPIKPYLYKIHGCISRPAGMVVTEEDYVNFLTNAIAGAGPRRILGEALSRITKHKILFIGYSLSDWNFRVIFKATAEKAIADQTKTNDSYAIQKLTPEKDPDEMEKKRDRWQKMYGFWREKKVTILDHDAADFLRRLIATVKKQQQA